MLNKISRFPVKSNTAKQRQIWKQSDRLGNETSATFAYIIRVSSAVQL